MQHLFVMSHARNSLKVKKLTKPIGSAENLADKKLKYVYIKIVGLDMFLKCGCSETGKERTTLSLSKANNQQFDSSLVWKIKYIDKDNIQITHWETGFKIK